jgi:PAP2 superfamily
VSPAAATPTRRGPHEPTREEGPGFPRPLDRLVIGYGIFSGFVSLAGAGLGGAGCLEQAWWCFGIAAGMAAVGMATRRATNRWIVLLRLCYAPIFFWSFYHQAGAVWPAFHAAPFDGLMAAADRALFGFQPSLRFQELVPSRLLSEVFCFAYLAYFFYIPVLLFTAWAGSYTAAERIVFASGLCFFFCYTLFWLFPTVAPHYWFPPHLGPRPYSGYLFNHALFFFTSNGEIRGGAFPSSHIAVATLLTVYARRETPRLFPYFAVITALLYPAVVYLHAHYFVDVPTGIAVGLLAAAVADPLQARWSRRAA